MDYVVGSVAALISGNVTPNRPKLLRRAFTPTKHQASPNVTPKSELVEDRSIFLSPTLQKKKAIIKKSPKRIFQNTDLDATDGEESTSTSPKADKVKKHLKDDLDANDIGNNSLKSPDSKPVMLSQNVSQKKGKKNSIAEDIREMNESTPKKKKKNQVLNKETIEPTVLNTISIDADIEANTVRKSPKKKNKHNNTTKTEDTEFADTTTEVTIESKIENEGKSPKKNKKKNKSSNATENMKTDKQTTTQLSNLQNLNNNTEKLQERQESQAETNDSPKKKNKRRKKKPKNNETQLETNLSEFKSTEENQEESSDDTEVKETKKNKNYVNPNAITDKDTDSEHESDDEIESENEEINKEVLEEANTEPAEDSSDEEQEKSQKPEKKEIKEREVATEDEVKRTIFVGNVPFSSKCKKEIKKIFSKHGPIETVRIRTVPVKDARVTPKLAIIKKELHPERSTVNVYVKFRDQVCVENALSENNTVLNGNHLRVSRSSCSGAEHEPARSVFVGNLPFALEDDTLREKFQACGEIDSVRIIRDRKTNAGKGFGYVNFASKDGVELALALSEEDLTIKNRILRVKRCTPTQKQKPQTHQQYHQQRQQNRQQSQNRPQNKRQFQQDRNAQNGGFKKFGNQAANQRGAFNKFGGKPGQFGGKPGQFGGKPGHFGGKPGQEDEGAIRRLQNKRKYQEGNTEGPPNKRQKDINQPIKEKKTRKEFVGMTAEKKKKNKFDKGQKKKKALSEILTKRVQ